MPTPNDPSIFTHRPDDYSDEFNESAFETERWSLSGSPAFTISNGRARVQLVGGAATTYLINLVTLPRRT
jgi:hypothetical protein